MGDEGDGTTPDGNTTGTQTGPGDGGTKGIAITALGVSFIALGVAITALVT
jgi:hypothetical protein